MSSSTSSADPGSHNSQLTESFSTPRFLGSKASYYESFNVISRFFICMRQLTIIDYVQSQRTAKTCNMESLMSNGFIEKYSTTPMDRFKGDLRPKTDPCFYVIILLLIILWKKSLVQSFVVLISSQEVMKL